MTIIEKSSLYIISILLFVMIILLIYILYLRKQSRPVEYLGGADIKEISLREPWYSRLKSGEKTFEMRAAYRHFANFKLGDTIKIYRKPTQDHPADSYFAKIIAVRNYNNAREAFEKDGIERFFPGITSMEEALLIHNRFLSAPEIAKRLAYTLWEEKK